MLGALPTLYDSRTTHSRDVLLDVADRYDLPVLAPPIPRTVRFAEASASGSSVLAGRKTKGGNAYRELAAALIKHWKSGRALPTFAPGSERYFAPKAASVPPCSSTTIEPVTSGTTGPSPGGCASGIKRSLVPVAASWTPRPPATGMSSLPAMIAAGPTGDSGPVVSTA